MNFSSIGGSGSNWVGTSGGAEGDIFEELLTCLKDEHFNVKECTIDHDAPRTIS